MSRVAVVTGAAGAVGAAVCSRLRAGGDVVVGLDTAADSGTEITEIIHCDVSDEASVAAAFDTVRDRHGEAASEARNVLGEIPGSDLAHELVMLGAHFDTWHASPNASDNSSGVAVMLEAMRILKAVGAEPRRTIRIALWSGEEQGIFGSRAYVKQHFGDPETGTKPDYDNFSAYFNQDYGPGRYRGVWLQENEHVRPIFEAWMAPFHDFGVTTLAPASVGSTDHVAFDDAGLPGFQFLQARVGGTGGHTNLDFYDTLPIDDLKKNAVVVAAFVYHAAMADEKLPRKGRK